MSGDIRVEFGRRLRRLRLKSGWTQDVMAEKFGLDRSYLAEIELGKRNPSLINLKLIADGFKVSLSRLFSGL